MPVYYCAEEDRPNTHLGHMLLSVGQIVLHPVHDGGEHLLFRRYVQLAIGD